MDTDVLQAVYITATQIYMTVHRMLSTSTQGFVFSTITLYSSYLDLLGGQHVPVLLQGTSSNLLQVNVNLHSIHNIA